MKPEPQKPSNARFRTTAALGFAVFAAAVVVRLVYAAQAWRCPLFQYPTIDAGVYYLLAHEFSSGHWLYPVGEPYWQPPFYSAVLAIWMKAAGDSVFAAKCAQLVLGSVNCVLVFAVGLKVFARRAGIIAGLVAAFYAPMIYFDGELLTPTLQIFLNLCAILLLASALERTSLVRFAAAGLLMGFSVVTRPDVLLFAAAACVWTFVLVNAAAGRNRAAVAVLLLAACAAAPVVPVALRNRLVGNDSVLISYNGGVNFYIGNNPLYEKTLAIRPGPEWDALVDAPLRVDPGMKPSAQSSFFYRKSWRYIRSEPLDYLKLLAKKTAAYLTAVEGRRNHDLYFLRSYSSLYSLLLFRIGPFAFPLGVIFPLALLGIMRRPRGAGSSLLLLYLAANLTATVAFFVVARYRVTAAPVFILFAAHGLVELCRMIRERRFDVRAAALSGALLILCNSNVPGVDRDRRLVDADSHYFVAGILDGDGKDEQAIPEYELAIKLNPNYALSRLNYGRMLLEMGRLKQAARQLREAVRLDPRSAAANWLLAEALAASGSRAASLSFYERAVKLDAGYADGIAHAAVAALKDRDYALAARLSEIVLARRPKYAQVRHTLGVALLKLGRIGPAIREFERTISLDPGSSETWLALGYAYQKDGRIADSDAAYKRAIAIGPREEMRARVRDYRSRR